MKKRISPIILNFILPGLGFLDMGRYVLGSIFTLLALLLCSLISFGAVMPTLFMQQAVQVLYLVLWVSALTLSFVLPFEQKKSKWRFPALLVSGIVWYIIVISIITYPGIDLKKGWESSVKFGNMYGKLLGWSYSVEFRNILYDQYMTPTILGGSLLYFEKIDADDKIMRGDFVQCDPHENNQNYARYRRSRVIGLPGEKLSIRHGFVFIGDSLLYEPWLNLSIKEYQAGRKFHGMEFDKDIELGPDEYFLLTDNRVGFMDSEFLGPFKRDSIQKRLRYFQNTPLSVKLASHFQKGYHANFAVQEFSNKGWFLVHHEQIGLTATKTIETPDTVDIE